MLAETITKTNLWDRMIKDSDALEVPTLYKDFFDEPFFTEQDVRDAIMNWGGEDLSFAKSMIRVFLNGGLSYSQGQAMFKNLPGKEEGISDYFDRLFNKQKYGVFLASIGRYNENITRKVTKMMKPLCEAYGYRNFRYGITLIMGNYGFTPFGIHHDADVGRTLHILSGKGKKELKCWNREEMIQRTNLTDRTRYVNIQQHFPYATTHVVGENDLFMLPVQHYHVGYVEDFTMDIVITFRRINAKVQLFEGMNQFYKTLSDQFDDTPPSYDPNVPIDHSQLEVVKPNLSDPNWYEKGIRERAARLESNLGIEAQPVFNSLPEGINLKEQTIQVKDPFYLVYEIEGDHLDLYVRSRDIKLFNDPALLSFIQQMNSGEPMKVSDALHLFEKASIEETDALDLIQLLYEYHGIIFV